MQEAQQMGLVAELHVAVAERSTTACRISSGMRGHRNEATRSNETWAMEFVHDQLVTGRKIQASDNRGHGLADLAPLIRGLAIEVKRSYKRWNKSVPGPVTHSRSATIRAQSLWTGISTSGLTGKVSRQTSRGQESQQTPRSWRALTASSAQSA